MKANRVAKRTVPTSIGLRLTPEEKKEISSFVDDNCINMSALVRKLVFRYIRSHRDTEEG